MLATSFLFSYLAYGFSGKCIVADVLVAAIKIQIIKGIIVEVSVQLQLVNNVALKQRM